MIDGQHRVGMMSILEERRADQSTKEQPEHGMFDLDRILVEVYPQPQQQSEDDNDNNQTKKQKDGDDDNHAQEIFLEINKAEPVKLVDLPGVRGLSQADRNTINDGAQRLLERFPDMFSTSQRCRAPHLNIDNLRDALFASDLVKRHSIKSSKALEAFLMDQNEVLKQKYNATDETGNSEESASKTALAKARKFDFYLGLDSSWLYQ